MDIMELGAIGELVGGVAVIASLIYVGLQVRQSTVVARAASHHGITDSFNAFNLEMARNPKLAQIFVNGNQDRGSLGDEERLQYDWAIFGLLRVLESLHFQSRVGFAERQQLEENETAFVAVLSGPGAQEWWHENPYPFSRDFARYVETLLRRSNDPEVGQNNAREGA